MASLTQSSITTRKIIRYGIFFIIFIFFLKLSFRGVKAVYLKLFPPAAPPPTVLFSRLPKLPFPDYEKKEGITLTLETADGNLPVFPEQMKVYFMPKLTSNLLALDAAKTKAQELGFNTIPEAVSETTYKFTAQNSIAQLQMNIVTGAFSISYNLKDDPSPVEKKPSSPEVLASFVRSYLSGASLMPEDLTGQTVTEFLKIEGENIIPAVSLNDADLVKIHFFRGNYDEFPTLTSYPNKANVWFMLSGSLNRDKRIVAGEYHYFPVDSTQSSTYPIKTSQQAWADLTSGKAYIASYGTNTQGGSVKIRRVYLAYFDPGSYMEFFQPIAVFEGDGNFIAYCPAVTDDYYGE